MKGLNRAEFSLAVVCFATASLLSAGCALYAMCFERAVFSESRQYPKKPEFSIQSTEQTEFSVSSIDFSAVYTKCESHRGQNGKEYNSFNFMRFWPSGHVYKRVLDHIPNHEEAESFRTAYMGFYQVSGTNLIIELYVPNWGYITSKGYMTENAIYEYEIERRDGRTRERYPKQYQNIKHHIDGLSRLPDWSPTGMLHTAVKKGVGR